jgi:hypothetical protein
MRRLLLVLLTCLGPMASLASAQTVRYLNPASGNDSWTGVNPSGGSPNGPWKTINKVAASVGPGYVVNIIGGNYNHDQIIATVTAPGTNYLIWTNGMGFGAAGNPVIIQPNPGDTVNIDGQQNLYFIEFWPQSGTGDIAYYVIVRGINFDNYNGRVFETYEDDHGARTISHVAIIGNRMTNIGCSHGGVLTGANADHIIWKDNYLSHVGCPYQEDLSHHSQHWMYMGHGWNYIVVDNNYMELNSGYGLHAWQTATDVTNSYAIWRRNRLTSSWESTSIPGVNLYDHFYIYNNTFHQDAIAAPFVNNDMARSMLDWHLGDFTLSNYRVKNNIGWGYVTDGVLSAQSNAKFNGSLVMDYNLWRNLNDPNATYLWGGVWYSLATFQATWGYDTHSKSQDPQFVNLAARDFSLQATSPARDAGTFLTTATNPGSGSTNLTVADAGYFHDGFGMIQGDTIQIGATGGQAPVVVTAVNYSTNTLTLQNPRTWANGATVGLPYSGSSPDMGAMEFDAAVSGPRTVYVSQTGGNDSADCDGGISAPRQTTAGGMACMTPGSTLKFRTGTYGRIDSGLMAIAGGIDWANPMTITAYAGEVVTVQAAAGQSALMLADAGTNHHIVIDGLIFDGLSTSGHVALLSGVNNIRVQRSTVKNAGSGFNCFHTPNSSNLEFTRNRVFGCEDGFNMGTVFTALVANNLVYNHDDRGIAVRGGSDSIQVYANSVYNAAGRGINIVSGAVSTTIRSNISFGNAGTCAGPATGSGNICDETAGAAGNVVNTNLHTSDPLWVSPSTGDFHLGFGSPAINQGVPLAEVPVDFEGNIRCTSGPCTSPPGTTLPEQGALEFFGAIPPSISSRFPVPPYTTHFLAR